MFHVGAAGGGLPPLHCAQRGIHTLCHLSGQTVVSELLMSAVVCDAHKPARGLVVSEQQADEHLIC